MISMTLLCFCTDGTVNYPECIKTTGGGGESADFVVTANTTQKYEKTERQLKYDKTYVLKLGK